MWTFSDQQTAVGPSYLVAGRIEVIPIWSDVDGVRVSIETATCQDMSRDEARELAALLAQIADLPDPA